MSASATARAQGAEPPPGGKRGAESDRPRTRRRSRSRSSERALFSRKGGRWGELCARHRFLAVGGRDEIEAGAELYFGALGYRRRADDDAALVFTRGRRWASLWTHSLRKCEGRVELRLEQDGADDGDAHALVVTLRHRVDVRGRIVTPSDRALLDAEARGFERFITGLDVELESLLHSARARRTRSLARWLPIAAGAAVLAGLIAWVVLARGCGV